MQLKILQERDNKLFQRKEIQAEIQKEVTPTKQETLKLISEKFSIPEENIEIKKIKGKFGSQIFRIDTNIYESEENKNQTERKIKKQKPEKKA